MLYTQLRSFHAVAREGSVTDAARVLNVSQPTLTTQVKQLEEHYGVALFLRLGKRLELTDLGRNLLLKTQHFFDAEAEVSGFLEAAQNTVQGHLRIAAIGPYPTMRFLRQYKKMFPNVTVSIDFGNSDEVLRSLREQRTDIGIVSEADHIPDISGARFCRQRIVVFVSVSHPWSARESVQLAELDGQDMVMREEGSTTRKVIERAFVDRNVKPNVVMEVGSREAVWEAVAEGHGIGVVSEISLRPDTRISSLAISDYDVQTDIKAFFLKQRRHPAAVRAFVELVRSTETAFSVNEHSEMQGGSG